MRCAIVILNWNGRALLEQYLPSVVEYSALPDCEVVVADNGSTDDSMAFVQSHFPSVRVVQLPKNYGFAEGYNQALKEVDSEYCVLLNSDVRVTEGWLEPLLQFMDEKPDVAAVQPKIRSDRREDYFEHAGAAGGFIDTLGYPFCRGRIMDYVARDEGQFDEPAQVFWATGACMCTRVRLYKELGGLDGRFFAHMEEIDLCWRMHSRGYTVWCLPQSVVYHLGGGSLNYSNPHKTYLNFRNNLLMLYKNLPKPQIYFVHFMRFWLDYVAALWFLLQGKAADTAAIIHGRWDFLKMRHSFRPARKENLNHMKVKHPSTIAKRSIIFDYYILRKKQ